VLPCWWRLAPSGGATGAWGATVTRPAWLVVAAIFSLGGLDLGMRGWLGWTPWFLAGMGGGIVCALLGSLIYDALIGPWGRGR